MGFFKAVYYRALYMFTKSEITTFITSYGRVFGRKVK